MQTNYNKLHKKFIRLNSQQFEFVTILTCKVKSNKEMTITIGSLCKL